MNYLSIFKDEIAYLLFDYCCEYNDSSRQIKGESVRRGPGFQPTTKTVGGLYFRGPRDCSYLTINLAPSRSALNHVTRHGVHSKLVI